MSRFLLPATAAIFSSLILATPAFVRAAPRSRAHAPPRLNGRERLPPASEQAALQHQRRPPGHCRQDAKPQQGHGRRRSATASRRR